MLDTQVRWLPVEQIAPNPHQPRREFAPGPLAELAESIRRHGIIQPLSVRRRDDGWELIAGERRLRAAKLAGLQTVPCLEMQVDEQDSAILALIENIQRRDLHYLEEAAAIALHFVNYKAQAETTPDIDYGSIIEQATGIIEQELQVTVDRDSFNYYRFVTHMHYMMKRTLDDAMIDTQNRDIFESMKKEYPSIYSCSVKVAALIEQQLKKSLSEEEILYLILHINRLCAREDCDR